MKPAENIEKLIKNIDIDTNARMDKAVFDDVLKALENSKKKKVAVSQSNIWRIIMKSRVTKRAAAAAIVMIAVLSLISLEKSTTAYAIEQTIEACKAVRCFHFKYLTKPGSKLTKEAWVEYDKDAALKDIRVNYYKWGGYDIVQVWSNGITQQWNKSQNTLTFLNNETFTSKILYFAQRYNPKGAVEYFYEMQKNGEVEVEIDQQRDQSEPIVLTVNYLPNTYLRGTEIGEMREVFYINQNTKFVTSVEIYELKENTWLDLGLWEYCDYDKPIDSKIFSLEQELPDTVLHVYDYSDEDIGLEQGDLTDQEIAVKVVRTFLEALIANNYAQAGRLLGGMPDDEVEENFGKQKILKVLSIDEPMKSDKPSGLRVPCVIEIEEDGKVIERQLQKLFVRKVYGHPDRWRIFGGI